MGMVNVLQLIDDNSLVGKLPDVYQNTVESVGFQSKAYQALDEEMASFQRSQAELRGSESLPDVPLAVISSSSLQDFPPGFSADYMKNLWDELQADLSKSPTAQHITAADSGHYIHIDRPELVIETIIETVNLIREQ